MIKMSRTEDGNLTGSLFSGIAIMLILIGLASFASTFANIYAEDDVVLVDGSNPMTGDLQLSGGARVYRGSWIPATGLRAPPTKPAAFIDHGISGAWEFSDGAEEQVVGTIRLNGNRDITEDIIIQLGWSSPAQSLNCAWNVSYLFTGLNEDTTASAQETLQSFETSSSTANGMTISEFTIDNAQMSSVDICIHLSILRDGNEEGDTLSNNAHLHGICLRYISDKLGAVR